MQPSDSSDVLTHLSRNVRRLRLAAGLSQAALADQSGVSRRTVIKLEAGEANISLTGLDRLAESLGVTFVDLVAEPSAPRSSINEIVWRGQLPGSVATMMASVPASKEAQLLIWTLMPTERYVGEPDPAGWSEMVLVLEGSLRIETTTETVTVQAGEHYAFATDQDFTYINDGEQLTRFARIVVS